MLRITSHTSNEMIIDNGSNVMLIGIALIIIGIAATGYTIYISYPSLYIEVLISPAAIVIVGVILTFSTSWTRLVIKKDENQIFIQNKRLIGARMVAYNVADV